MGIDIVKANDNFSISNNYESSLDIQTKKTNGIYYTPEPIVDYIIENTLRNHDIVKNPYPKILDLSCGCGNFLLEAYDILYKLFEDNIYELKTLYGDVCLNYNNIHNHIISNCIYGADIDNKAIEILKNSLISKDEYSTVDSFNLYCCDSLKHTWECEFDYIIGNPPYIGHKGLDKGYKKYLLENYSQVYKDKSDVYFCFYKKIIDILKEGGISSLITPRYFLESPSGKYLREFMANSVNINEIVDFLGVNIFKNIGIASCIVRFSKEKDRTNEINIFKIRDENLEISKSDSLKNLVQKDLFEHFLINQIDLGKDWILANKCDKEFYEKIQSKCEYTLEDIVQSFQGIITGCDKAFILKNSDERLYKIDTYILKNWIKNKDVDKYIINESNHKLIYADDIEDEKKYNILINECIEKYKDKLENRRECKKNLRKWYELQWGREKSLFEREKIMYPYKAKQNRFAIDYSNYFSSADVYSFFIKEEYTKIFSHEYLVGILNSSIYDKYFKITAKKMSKNIFDYYPNKVMKIKIFKDNNYSKIEELSKEIINILYNKTQEINKIEILQYKIDELIKLSLGV
ncbi:MAG: N-6 DNA methylase [Romboutsia sp.]